MNKTTSYIYATFSLPTHLLVPHSTTMTRASVAMDVQAPMRCAGLDPFRYRASRAQLDFLSYRPGNHHPDFHRGHSAPHQQHPSPFSPACVPVFLRPATLLVSSLNTALTGISLVMQHVHVEHSFQFLSNIYWPSVVLLLRTVCFLVSLLDDCLGECLTFGFFINSSTYLRCSVDNTFSSHPVILSLHSSSA